MLLQIRKDSRWMRVEVEGRFSIEREAALNDRHRMAAIQDMQERMIAAQAKLGSHYLGEDFTVIGPLKHVSFDENWTPDEGPGDMPDPRDTRAMARYRLDEQRKVARKPGERADLVDYVLKTAFRRRVRQELETIAPQTALTSTASGLLVPASALRS